MVCFTVPTKPITKLYRGKDSEYKNKKNNIKLCQHKAWMDDIIRGYENGRKEHSHARNVRLCIHHFHPSVIYRKYDGKHELKIGASPAVCLTKFSFDNDNHKENKTLSRIMGRAEDL